MKRYASLIGLDEAGKANYIALHAAVWPAVLAKIADCNIRNYSIFLKEPENLLFSYFEYHGSNFESDMAHMAADPDTQKWWDINKPLQRPLDTRQNGEWWADIREIFHVD